MRTVERRVGFNKLGIRHTQFNEEIRRRTRVARLFPNEAACLRLVSAIRMEISEDWQSAGKRYVVFNNDNAIEG